MSVPTRINTRHKTPSCPFQHASTHVTKHLHVRSNTQQHVTKRVKHINQKTTQTISPNTLTPITKRVHTSHKACLHQSQNAFTPITKRVHANHKAPSRQSQSAFTPITTHISRIHNTREHSTDMNTTRRARQCHVQTVLTDCLHDNRWNFQRLGSQNATCVLIHHLLHVL